MIHLRLNFEEGLEREYVYHVVPAMQNEKVKAGVLLYALLMAAIFSLLLQFYLHRQVAERRILKTSQERLRAYALVQLALEKERVMRRHQRFILKSGTVQLRQDTGFLHAQAKMNGESYEFVLPVRGRKGEARRVKKKRRRHRKIRRRQRPKRLLKRRQKRPRNHQKIAKKTNFWYDRVRRKS